MIASNDLTSDLMTYITIYLVSLSAFFVIDLLWLTVFAKGFYQEQLGHLMRTDVKWVPALLFYLIYIAAVEILCVLPAIEKESLWRALGLGSVFGLSAYATFDLTSLALLKDFPLTAVIVDLIWGTVLTTSVSAAGYWGFQLKRKISRPH